MSKEDPAEKVELTDENALGKVRQHLLNLISLVATYDADKKEWWGHDTALDGKDIEKEIDQTLQSIMRDTGAANIIGRCVTDITGGEAVFMNKKHYEDLTKFKLPKGATPCTGSYSLETLEDFVKAFLGNPRLDSLCTGNMLVHRDSFGDLYLCEIKGEYETGQGRAPDLGIGAENFRKVVKNIIGHIYTHVSGAQKVLALSPNERKNLKECLERIIEKEVLNLGEREYFCDVCLKTFKIEELVPEKVTCPDCHERICPDCWEHHRGMDLDGEMYLCEVRDEKRQQAEQEAREGDGVLEEQERNYRRDVLGPRRYTNE